MKRYKQVIICGLMAGLALSGKAQWCSAPRASDGSVFYDGAFNGTILVASGSYNEFDSLGEWAYIAGFDTTGALLWQRGIKMDPYGSQPDNFFTTITALPDGDFLAVMTTGNGVAAITTLMQFTPTGDTVWTRTYKVFNDEEYFYVAKPLNNGEVLVAGKTVFAAYPLTYALALVWVNPVTGNIRRVRVYNFPAIIGIWEVRDFVQLGSKLYLVANSAYSSRSAIICIDTAGTNIQWTRVFSTNEDTVFLELQSITSGPNAALYVAGYTIIMGNALNGRDGAVVMAMDTTGTVQWAQQYVSQPTPYLTTDLRTIFYDSVENRLLVGGYSYSHSQIVMALDLSGQLLWAHH